MKKLLLIGMILQTFTLAPALAFTTHQSLSLSSKRKFDVRNSQEQISLNSELVDRATIEDGDEEMQETMVSSPLRYKGPYASLGLRFPLLATTSQRKREVSGISLDFVLDTAANTNTINAQVADELQLESIGSALPGYGAGGAIDGAETFMLGNCTLDVPGADMFMLDLSASALAIPSPTTAGILGVAFLNVFQGGVKFQWGGGLHQCDPLVTFYAEKEGIQKQLDGMTKVPIDVIEGINLPSVTLNINGATIPALLDTGSPVTVLNSVAAEMAGLDVFEVKVEQSKKITDVFNPFKKIAEDFKTAQATAEATAKGEILMMAGPEGPIQLAKTKTKESISLGTGSDIVTFPKTHLYVGNLPGLAALGGLEESPIQPGAILGLDVIKRLGVMVYRENEVYFS